MILLYALARPKTIGRALSLGLRQQGGGVGEPFFASLHVKAGFGEELFYQQQCGAQSGRLGAAAAPAEVEGLGGKGAPRLDKAFQLGKILVPHIVEQVAANDEVAVDQHSDVINRKGKVLQVLVPYLSPRGIPLSQMEEKRVEIFPSPPPKGVRRAEGLDTALFPAIAGGAVGIQADVLQDPAGKSFALVDLPVQNQRAAKIEVQDQKDTLLDFRTEPQLGKGGAFRVVDQGAGEGM